MAQNKRKIGTAYEQLAVSYLQTMGVTILEANFRCRQGEIDLIYKDGEYLVFGEVKYRRDAQYGEAILAVDDKKQRRICRVSDYYRLVHQISEFTPMRFDVISIDGNQISWYKDAFPYR